MRLPLVLPVKPSPILLVTLSTAHGVALLVTLVAEWPIVAKVLAVLALMFSAWSAIAAQTSSRDDRPIALGLRTDGVLHLHYRYRDAQPATLSASTTVFPWLIILWLKMDGRRLSLCLPQDALGSEGHRQLRLWLTWLAKTEK